MIGRSPAVATAAERGEDYRPDPIDDVEYLEPGRGEHDPVSDTVSREGVPYHIDKCSKCGISAPRRDGICRGANRGLDEFGE